MWRKRNRSQGKEEEMARPLSERENHVHVGGRGSGLERVLTEDWCEKRKKK